MFGGATISQADKKHTKWLKSVAKCYTFADESYCHGAPTPIAP